ncbi:MAG TPA: response regulator [Rhodocyclaceae bacterium]|nr:response regulator [Rhodocyclaceae bacterium]
MAYSLANARAAEVLLVEDNFYDVILMRESFSRAKLLANLHHVENGEAGLSFLRKKGKFADAPTPDLVLLDINLPLVDGREVMREVAADDRLRPIPVVALATSATDASIEEMRRLGCPLHMVKPVDFEQLQRVVRGIAGCWFSLVIVPSST